jgi:hypothetical protein
LYFSCGVCGLSTGTVENDVAEDEIDTQMPPDWLEVTVRRVVVNPDWKKPRTVEEIVEGLVSQIGSAPPDGVDPKILFRSQAEMQVAVDETTNPSQHMVEEVQFHISPQHLEKLTELDTEAFEEMAWAIPKKEETSEEPAKEEKNES